MEFSMSKSLVFALTVIALIGAPYVANAATQLSQDQCEAVWNKADSAKAGSLTQDQAAPYIADFKSANASGSGMLTQDEFMAACGKGLVHDSASSGASTGSSGSTSTPQ
jgi:hypothetical protein